MNNKISSWFSKVLKPVIIFALHWYQRFLKVPFSIFFKRSLNLPQTRITFFQTTARQNLLYHDNDLYPFIAHTATFLCLVVVAISSKTCFLPGYNMQKRKKKKQYNH